MNKELVKVFYDLAPPAHDRQADLALRMAQNRCIEDGPELRLFRPLPDKLRSVLTARAVALHQALKDDSPNLKAAYVADMLGSYDPRRQVTRETQSELAKWLADLAGIPTWAVCRACAMVKDGRDDISDHFRPTTIQLKKLCHGVMATASTEAIQIERVLTARPDGPALTDDERSALGIRIKTFADEFKAGKHQGPESVLDAMARERRDGSAADLA